MLDYNQNYFGGDDREERPSAEPNQTNIVSNGIPKIKVIGVGGAGNNAVNRMIEAGIKSAEYIAVNTDAQILLCNKAPNKLQIGAQRTKGLGAGADPEVGREAAEESREALSNAIEGTDLLFITAGMGGGTGTGAAPVIAKIAKDKKILTVAVVTEPFDFEGRRRMENAMKGIDNLRRYVDTLVIIPNEKINDIINAKTTINEAFSIADDVLKQGIRGIADLIVTPALINLDFADVRTVLKDQGLAHMGVGVAKGDNRIVEAVRLAVNSPLLETTIEGAKGVIVNVVGGPDLTLNEVSTAAGLVHGVVDYNAMIIVGACVDPQIQDEVEVTVIATGFPSAEAILNELDARQAAYAQAVQQPNVPEQGVPPLYASKPTAPQPQAQPVYGQQPANPYAQPAYGQQPANPYGQPQAYVAPEPVIEEEEEPAFEPVSEPEPEPDDKRLPPFVRRLLGKRK